MIGALYRFCTICPVLEREWNDSSILYIFILDLFIFICMNVLPLCMCIICMPGTWGNQKWVLASLELEL